MKTNKEILEFNQIIDQLMGYAMTEVAKERMKEMDIILSETALMAAIRETDEARDMLDRFGRPPLAMLTGVKEALSFASKGGCLKEDALMQIAMTLSAVARMKVYLSKGKDLGIPLAYYEENLVGMEEVLEEIHRTIRHGHVDDYASKRLHQLRVAIAQAEGKVRDKTERILKQNQSYMSDQFITVRNGRLCVPLKKSAKGKVKGQVIDQSATGTTLFIEPAEVRTIHEEIENLRIEEENEVQTILYILTAMVLEQEEAFEENIRYMERLDYIFAKGAYSQQIKGVSPIFHEERSIHLEEAQHPLMESSSTIPLNFDIGRDNQGIVITGPNTGGKTVAIKTVGLLSYMAQCGLHVPAKKATMCMHSNILCDIGDGQNIQDNLSTFSSHIKRVLYILEHCTNESLVIMDELGSGTDPTEGMGIAIAILQALKEVAGLYLVTTHYPEVKRYARLEGGVMNARMTFDLETLQPQYQLIIGEAGESCALQIAKSLGMPQSLLQRAEQAAYGQDSVEELMDIKKELTSINKTRVKIQRKMKKQQYSHEVSEFSKGDSVVIYPEEGIGIIYQKADEKGNYYVQYKDEKVIVNHKRLKLRVSASELYPPNYDFSIIFDTVETRKARHSMERKHIEGLEIKE